MKIAFFSDVHGNLPALRAVLEEITGAKPDRTLCLGDLVFKGPASADCLNLIQGYHIEVIYGNTERMLLGRELPGNPAAPLEPMLEWHRQRLNTMELAWLAGLPEQISIDTPAGQLMAVHGTPKDCVTPIFPHSDFEYVQQVLMGVAPRWLVVGHTHMPMTLQHGPTTIINPGAVGFSLDGDWRASWALLDTDSQQVSHHRVEFNLEEAVDLAKERDFYIPAQEYREWLLRAKQ